MTRTQNSVLNLITNIGSSVLVLVLNFVTRAVFIKTLGTSFLGIEGLFTNILTMLSLAELGFGSAIVFKLYQPIAANDIRRIQILLKLYRRVYFVVGAAVLVVGLGLIPFLPRLIKDYETLSAIGLNAVVIFLLYLFNSVSSYWFFAYKTTFVQANQKSYILTVVGYAITIGSCVAQLLVLRFFHNFTVYLIVQISFNILTSLVYAFICDRKYPYVRETMAETISPAERKEFFKDCSSLLLYRINGIVANSTDNILLSAFLGLSSVGLYSNYLALKKSINTLLYTFLDAANASIGDLYTSDKLEWTQLIFRVVNFLTFFLYGIAAIGFSILANDFIALWLGESYTVTCGTIGGEMLRVPLALLIGIELYLTGQSNYCGTFRKTMGLFQELKYRPIFSMLVNLAVGLLLVPRIGIAGCVISTIAAALTTTLLFDPLVIHRCGLKLSPGSYFLRNFLYKLLTVAAGLVSWKICALIPLAGILGFVVHGCVCVLIPALIFMICFYRSVEFRYLLRTVKELLPITSLS